MYQPFPLRQNVIQLLLELDDGVQFEFELDIVVYRVLSLLSDVDKMEGNGLWR